MTRIYYTGNSIIFKNVWYLARPIKLTALKVTTSDDQGILMLTRKSIRFQGRTRRILIPIREIYSISVKQQGRDFINPWMIVRYGKDECASFADAGFLGWSGVLGGTRHMSDVVRRALHRVAE